jgi:hypothetical protein
MPAAAATAALSGVARRNGEDRGGTRLRCARWRTSNGASRRGLFLGPRGVRQCSFLAENGPKGIEKVQVWYRSRRKLAVPWGLRSPVDGGSRTKLLG